MPNSKEVLDRIIAAISLDEPHDEIRSIAGVLMEHEYQVTRADIIAGKSLDNFDNTRLQLLLKRINQGEPIQYIFGEQFFYGRKFLVNSSVLIPRPETELLVDLSKAHLNETKVEKPVVLDIGTGSGCIAITIELEAPGAEVHATDISEAALGIAKRNAELLGAEVLFHHHDILAEEINETSMTLIVSNPPYITQSEISAMKKNVVGFEPHQALFVGDEDPLLFYKAIAIKSSQQLTTGGLLAMEINERFGKEVAGLFENCGLQRVEIVRDLADKDRVVKGYR